MRPTRLIDEAALVIAVLSAICWAGLIVIIRTLHQLVFC
jgi:hypothetical protein